jgi:hypothetical protein
MSTEQSELETKHPEGEQRPADHFEAKVTVNGKAVVLRKHRLSGLEIKQAAINQGVSIEINFVLQEELPNGHSKIIGDRDEVEVHNHDRFTAIPNDDNS